MTVIHCPLFGDRAIEQKREFLTWCQKVDPSGVVGSVG